jgi:hypothetical protein
MAPRCVNARRRCVESMTLHGTLFSLLAAAVSLSVVRSSMWSTLVVGV